MGSDDSNIQNEPGVETACNADGDDRDLNPDAPVTSTGWVPFQDSSVNSPADCAFTCAKNRAPDATVHGGTGKDSRCGVNTGYVVIATEGLTVSNAPADLPYQGYYANNGEQMSCNTDVNGDTVDANGDKTPDHPVTSMGWVPLQASSVNNAADCAFTCAFNRAPDTTVHGGTGKDSRCGVNPGYIVTATGGPTGSNAMATLPAIGYYANNGVQMSCNIADTNRDNVPDHPVTSTGWSSFQPTSVTTAGACVFRCAVNRAPDTNDNGGTGKDSSCGVNSGYVVTAVEGLRLQMRWR